MNHISQCRERAGISQVALYRRLNWKQSRLANYESGVRHLRLSDARLIVLALNELGANCTLDEVFPPPLIAILKRSEGEGHRADDAVNSSSTQAGAA